MTGLGRVFDAAYPPSAPPAGAVGVLGYIGGALALNTWTSAQWQPFARLAQFPCYVPDLNADAVTQATDACNRAGALGWQARNPLTRVIIFDLETSIDAAWFTSVQRQVGSLGYQAVAYGSLPGVEQNKAAVIWGADYNGVPQLEEGQAVRGDQFAANVTVEAGGELVTVDWSIVDDWMMARAGSGPRR